MERIGVYHVNDNRLLRESVKRLFDSTDDIGMLGTAATLEAALDDLPRARPDVLMVQCHACGGRRCGVQRVKAQFPQMRVLLFAMPEDEQEFFASIFCGATGYLLKDASAEDLLSAVRALNRNEAVIPRSLTLALVELAGGFRSYPAQSALRAEGGLSDRERQLVPLLTAGFSNKQIAARLGIAEQTVKNHVRHILGKLKLKHRSEVATDYLLVLASTSGQCRITHEMGGWSACQECYLLIERDDRTGLLRRAAQRLITAEMPTEGLDVMRRVHAAFFDHRSGPPIPVDPVAGDA